MEMVARYYPDVPVSGIASGHFALNGPLSDLAATARIETPGGPVVADARFDAFDPGAHYRLEASVADFDLSGLLAEAPEPTRFSAKAFVDGRGFDPASMWASARLEVGSARVGHLDVDTAATFMRIAAGVLTFDTIMANTSVVDLDGSGTLALADGAPEGEVRLAFLGETLDGLRPFLLGETVIAGDTLTEIERLSLAMEGLDPDDLPDVDELTVTGRLAGDVTVRGGIRDFRTDGTVALEGVVYGEHSLRRANATFFAEGLRTPEWRVVSTLSADTIEVFDRSFAGAFAEGEYRGRDGGGEGQGSLRIQRDGVEDYRVRAAVEVEPDGGVVNLDELTLRFDAVQWNLGAPSIIAWSDDAVTVRDFRLIRPGVDGMRLEADGRIPFDGEIDFRLLVDALNLSRIAQLAQMDTEVAGTLSMGVEVTGHTREPIMNGTVFARDVRYDEFALSSIEGELSYLDRQLFGELEAWHGGRQVFSLAGNAPLDLALRDIERRLLDAPMELRVMVDSFPAANALSFLEDMRNVEGVLAGQLDIGGTPREPSPTGSMRLRGGAATLPALGVRYTGVEANLLLDADGRVLVNAAALSRGTARVEGTVQLDPFSDPSFDLLIVTNNFLAVDRRDMTARMGGEVNLTGRYSQPEIRGDVRVQEATLFLDEFVRTADIIDLTDPSFWNVVDTSVVAAQPIIEAQNPFLQNLQLDVNLVVARDTWLRSREINVEMGGELAVNYNRSRNELVLSGSLQAIRGAYTQFGRQFQVREGTVDFPGTPGIDPNMNIQAVNRLRTAEGEPLDIIATVRGTLTNLRVQLSSESQPPIAESDLVSYLIFGRPSYALASGEQSILQGTRGAVESLGAGALASQLGSVFAPLLGVDYFAVTQGDQGTEVGADRVTGAFAATQFEVGQYFLDNLFVAFLYRPQANQLPGVRAEWRFSDLWTVESFVEDRFSRSGITGFSELGFQLSKVIGVSIFREWGY
jgi:translocation and assembly module TamB